MGASKLSDGEGLRGARDSGVLGQDARDAGRGTEDEAGCAAGGRNAQIGLRPAVFGRPEVLLRAVGQD